MKPAFYALLPVLVLAGCAHKPTLEEAQEQCLKQGGMLVLVYTQEITAAGPGPQVINPGNCVLASKFDAPATTPPAPAAPP